MQNRLAAAIAITAIEGCLSLGAEVVELVVNQTFLFDPEKRAVSLGPRYEGNSSLFIIGEYPGIQIYQLRVIYGGIDSEVGGLFFMQLDSMGSLTQVRSSFLEEQYLDIHFVR